MTTNARCREIYRRIGPVVTPLLEGFFPQCQDATCPSFSPLQKRAQVPDMDLFRISNGILIVDRMIPPIMASLVYIWRIQPFLASVSRRYGRLFLPFDYLTIWQRKLTIQFLL